MAMAETVKYKYKFSPSLDGLKRGGLLRYRLSSWKNASRSSVQAKAWFNVLKKGGHLSVALETNLLRAAILLVSFWTFLTVLGYVMLNMACTFFGFASIPLWDIMNLKNFLEDTSKAHLLGFNFIWYCQRVANVSFRSSKWTSSSLLLTSMSSIYTSIFLPICLLNILFTNL